MKKTKRILSAITALAISASAFAGLAIPASADAVAETSMSVTGGVLTVVSDKVQLARLIDAKYDDNNSLTAVSTSLVNLNAGENVLNLALEEGDKLMLWSDIAADPDDDEFVPMVPLCDSIIVPSAEKPAPEGAYFYDTFDYETTGVDVQGTTDQEATMGNFKVYVGARGSGGDKTSTAAIDNKRLKLASGGTATSGRGASIAINTDKVTIPAFADAEEGNVIEYFFDAMFTDANSTIQLYGITSNTTSTGGAVFNDPYLSIANNSHIPLNEMVTVRASIKNDKTGYLTIEDQTGKLYYATAITAAGDTFTKLACYGAASTVYIDNFGAIQKENYYGTISATVLTDDEAPLAGANVTVDKFTVQSGADGTVSIPAPNGTHKVTASKSGYEHTAGQSDDHTVSVTVNSDNQTADLSLLLKTYIKLPDTVTIGGGQIFIAAPKTEDTATTEAFTGTVLDQYGIEMTVDTEYNEEWSIYPEGDDTANPNVTISDEGVVTVAKGFTAESENGVDKYDVTYTAKTADRGQTVAKTLYIGNMDILYYEPIGWDISGSGNDKDHRADSINFADEIALPDMFEINVNMAMKGLGNDANSVSSFGFVTDSASPLTGIQYSKTENANIKAWTQWGGKNMNASDSLGAFASSGVLVPSYTAATKMHVSFVVDKTNHSVTVSDGTTSVPLVLDESANPTKLTGLQTGHYRYYAGVTVDDITVRQPDTNYLGIAGIAKIAKVKDATIEREYTLSQSVIVPDETFTWSVENSAGSTTPAGVSIDDGTLSIDDTAVPGVYTIKAVSDINEDKKAEFEVTIDDFQTFKIDKAEISGPHAYQLGTDTTGTYKIERLVDSVGDDVAELVPAAAWSSSDTSVATIDEDTGVLTVVGAGTTNITATINNGTKADNSAATSVLTIPVTVGTYYVKSTTVGSTVDISSLVTSDKITGYQVTVADASGNKLAQEVVQKDGNNVAVPAYTGTAASVEVAPVFTYDLSNPGTLGVLGAGKDIPIPADRYNFNVKADWDRTDVYVNDQMLVNNILQGGAAVNNLDVNDIEVSEGNAKITIADCPSAAAVIIKVVKSPSNVTRKKKVYVLGDSLVCIYYNGGDATNNAQTGWGQVLQNYLTDDVEVVDLANSGVTGEGLASTAITQVAHSAQEGDIVLIECGYNDRSYSTQDKMKAALASMNTVAKAKGADVIFVSPNASHHDYSGNVVWTTTMEAYVTEAEAKYIDLSQKSYDFLSAKYGADFSVGSAVNDLSKVYNVSDRLHSTYNGANAWAAIVAGGLMDNGYESIVDTTHTYTFTDGKGDTITCKAEKTAE